MSTLRWQSAGVALGPLTDVHVLLLAGESPVALGAVARGVASAVPPGRRIAVFDLAGAFGLGDPDGLVRALREGRSLNALARPLEGGARERFVVRRGPGTLDTTVAENERWPRLVQGFRAAGALLLIAAPLEGEIALRLAKYADIALKLVAGTNGVWLEQLRAAEGSGAARATAPGHKLQEPARDSVALVTAPAEAAAGADAPTPVVGAPAISAPHDALTPAVATVAVSPPKTPAQPAPAHDPAEAPTAPVAVFTREAPTEIAEASPAHGAQSAATLAPPPGATSADGAPTAAETPAAADANTRPLPRTTGPRVPWLEDTSPPPRRSQEVLAANVASAALSESAPAAAAGRGSPSPAFKTEPGGSDRRASGDANGAARTTPGGSAAIPPRSTPTNPTHEIRITPPSSRAVQPRNRWWLLSAAAVTAALAAWQWWPTSREQVHIAELAESIAALPAATTAPPDTLEVPTVANPRDSASAASWGLVLLVTNDRAVANLRLAERRALQAATLSPVLLGDNSARWFRLTVGAFADRGTADMVRTTLRQVGTLTQETGVITRVPYALRLDTGLTPAAARERADGLAQRGIAAYALLDSDTRASVYAGAFASPQESALLFAELRAAGVTPQLAYRVGRSY